MWGWERVDNDFRYWSYDLFLVHHNGCVGDFLLLQKFCFKDICKVLRMRVVFIWVIFPYCITLARASSSCCNLFVGTSKMLAPEGITKTLL